jgi:hypothetical protein
MMTSTPSANDRPASYDILVAVVIFVLFAVLLVLFAGGRPGYDPDGASALHIAQNVAAGDGVVGKYVTLRDGQLGPLATITKPPFYPVSSGILIRLGLAPETAAWVISGGAWAAIAAFLFLLARQVLPVSYAILVPIFPALLGTSLRWGINIHEESLFVALSLATLWRLSLLSAASNKLHWGQYALLGILATLAMLTSYQGLPLVLVTVVYVLRSARRDGGVKPIAAFGFAMAAFSLWPMLRFVRVWLSGIRPGFDAAGETTYFNTLAGIASAFQNDLLGRQIVWLYSISLTHVILVTLFFLFLAGMVIYAAWKSGALRPLAAFFILYLVMLVAQLGGAGKDYYEPRYNLPVYGLFFLFIVYAIHRMAADWKKPAAGVGLSALAIVLLMWGQSDRYHTLRDNNGPFCAAPMAMSWIKQHIPAGSIIAAPQCGYQVAAENTAYYWLPIPPGKDPGKPERWDESNFLSACKFRVGVWIVLLDGKKKDPFLEKPGYGPFVTHLFNGQPGARTELATHTEDGLIYRLRCESSGEIGGAI